MKTLLAAHQVQLTIQEIDYDQWHAGEIVSDIWLNSANFTLPLDFSLFAHLCEVPLLQNCNLAGLGKRCGSLANGRNEPGSM